MKHLIAAVTLCLGAILTTQSCGADGMHKEAVNFAAGKSTDSVKATIKAGVAIDYRVKAAAGMRFDRTLTFQGISFHVTSANSSSINKLRIVPAGLEIDNSPQEREINGTVTGAEVADLNADGSPEIYVYVTSAGSGSYGSVVAFSANKRKSLSQINLPELAPDSAAAKGYMGHDEFAVVENVLARRFPIYREGDSNASPTGGMRQLQYKLHPGEAAWQLKVDRVTDF